MPLERLSLPADPAQALEILKEASRRRPTLVFKKSPRCPVSFAAEAEWREFLAARAGADLAVAEIDVVHERALARGLTELLSIRHESPQALQFRDGELCWHDSHERLDHETFRKRLEPAS